MQISRHWRLNSQRYRLQGVRYENGEVSLQARPNPPSGIEQGFLGVETNEELEQIIVRGGQTGTRGKH